MSANERDTIGLELEAMYRIGPHRAFDIFGFKNIREDMIGCTMSTQAVFDA